MNLGLRLDSSWALAWLALTSAACTQTDVVAVRASHDACATSDCMPAAPCAAHSCSDLSSKNEFCRDQGNAVAIGDGCNASEPSAPVFRFAICSCSDFVTVSPLVVDGPTTTAIAVDGELRVETGVRLAGTVRVGQTLRSGAATNSVGNLVEHAAPSCGCGDDELLDFSGELANRKSDNDDGILGRDTGELDGFSGSRELDLTCGRYYFTRVAGNGPLHMRIHGPVALFVAGNVELDDAWSVQLDSGARLTLIIAGNLRVTGRLELAAASEASSVRVLVGGGGTIDLGSESIIHAALYAPRAELVTRARFELTGALLIRRAAPGAEFVVHYAAEIGDPAANGCSG